MSNMKNVSRCSSCGFLSGEKKNLTGCVDILLLLRSGQSSRDVDSSTISRIRDDIDTLEGDINLLDEQIARLERKRQNVRKALAQRKSFLAPIRYLFPDILLKIFSMLPVHTLHVDHAPWVLTHVCIWWRTMLYSSPTLWSTIRTWRDLMSSHKPSGKDMIRQSLLLSRDCPLDIVINHSANHELASSMFKLLLTVRSRWESLFISVPSKLLSDPRLVSMPLPNLRELRLESDFSWVNTLVNIFSCAHNLTRVHLERLLISDIALPLPQLTHLSARFGTQMVLVSTIESCQSLVYLHICYIPRHGVDCADVATTPIVHPVLRSLRWSYGLPNFDRLSFPVMETLSIVDSGYHGQPISDISAFNNLIQRSKSTIRNLTLELTTDSTLRLFTLNDPAYSSITYLKMTISIASHFSDAKLVDLADPHLLPHLAYLSVLLCNVSGGTGAWDLQASHFNQTVQARWDHGRLKKLDIFLDISISPVPASSTSDAHEEIPLCPAEWHIQLSHMRRLHVEGLDITVWCNPYDIHAHAGQPETGWRKLRGWHVNERATEGGT